MKKLSLIVGAISAIGLAIKNMGNLSFENSISYGIILFISFKFIEALWNLVDKKSKRKAKRRVSI